MTNNGTITITRYDGPGGELTIPSSINGISVTGIGDYAFAYDTNVINVTIPNSVTNIGIFAFYLCPDLVAITVDTNNPTYSSTGGVLLNKSGTVLLQYPAGKPGSYTIPNSVFSVGDYAFEYCLSLTNVTISDSVTNIGFDAFYYSSGLTSVTLGKSVTGIGYDTFFHCSSLAIITVDTDNPAYSSVDGVLFDKSGTTLIKCPAGRNGSYTIGDSVTNVGDYAFGLCTDLTNIKIPYSVTSIGYGAFAFCPSLMGISVDTNNPAYSSMNGVLFNKSRTTLVQYPIARAGNYAVPEGVTKIGNYAFVYSYYLTSITVPDSVTQIGDGAFNFCSSLTVATLGNGVTNIGGGAFQACDSLTSITLPGSVTSIGFYAFSDCTGLTSVYFLGDEPNDGLDTSVFSADTNAIIYYLPGMSGWGSTFDGRPTALWLLPYPLIINVSPGFVVRSAGFGFTISWATNSSVVVEACTNLANPNWRPVVTNILAGGTNYFHDSESKNYPSRFYRIRSP